MSTDSTQASDPALRRAAVLATLSRSAEAAELLRDGTGDALADPVRGSRLATILWNAGDARGALEQARRLVERHPSSVDAQHTLAWFELQRGAAGAALEAARRAVALDGDRPHLLLLAVAALRSGATAEAREAAQRVATLDAEDSRAHEILGHIALADRRKDDAIASYERAIELDGSYAAHAGIALARTLGRGIRAAIDARIASLKVDQSDPEGWRALVALVGWKLRPWRALIAFGVAAFLFTGSTGRGTPTAIIVASFGGLVLALLAYIVYRRVRGGLPAEAQQAYGGTIEERNHRVLDIVIGAGAYAYIRALIVAFEALFAIARGAMPTNPWTILIVLIAPLLVALWWFRLRPWPAVPAYLYQDV